MLDVLNNSKIFWGLTMLVVNTSSRVVVDELTSNELIARIIKHENFKVIILFCMMFVGTKDAMVSLCMACAIFVGVQTFLSVKGSAYNIRPHADMKQPVSAFIPKHMFDEAMQVVNLYKKQQQFMNPQRQLMQNFPDTL